MTGCIGVGLDLRYGIVNGRDRLRLFLLDLLNPLKADRDFIGVLGGIHLGVAHKLPGLLARRIEFCFQRVHGALASLGRDGGILVNPGDFGSQLTSGLCQLIADLVQIIAVLVELIKQVQGPGHNG